MDGTTITVRTPERQWRIQLTEEQAAWLAAQVDGDDEERATPALVARAAIETARAGAPEAEADKPKPSSRRSK